MKMFMYNLSASKFLLSGMLLVGALLFGSGSLAAQEMAGSGANPEAPYAQQIGVVAYDLGTFDRDHSIQVFEQIQHQLAPLLQNNPSFAVSLKHAYVSRMLEDLQLYIATEITLLTSLDKAYDGAQTTTVGQQNTQGELKNLYNEVVAQLQ